MQREVALNKLNIFIDYITDTIKDSLEQERFINRAHYIFGQKFPEAIVRKVDKKDFVDMLHEIINTFTGTTKPNTNK